MTRFACLFSIENDIPAIRSFYKFLTLRYLRFANSSPFLEDLIGATGEMPM